MEAGTQYQSAKMRRTTILLDPAAEYAVQDLSKHYSCTASEAIRRSILKNHRAEVGVSLFQRQRRTKVLRRLIELADGHDAEAEIRMLKEADEWT